ncbi:MAG TPA: demethoxyubiquinone hydroxylase family protein [Candidatus Binatia bacterium]|nr:demethoxyubiquinone hydroxylase family protein [Candidatus Binatia bacterium]
MSDTRKTPHATAEDRLPGDPTKAQLIDRIIRVDHAGEYGAKRIYEGQLAMLRGKPEAAVVRGMYEQELQHLKEFERLMVERRARPSALYPLWHVAGFALGAATAFLGPKAAMACTVAVEEVIDEHYRAQAETLGTDERPLQQTIEKFRDDELHHRDAGLANGAEQAPAYPVLTAAIKAGSRLAIWLAERV